MIQIQKWITATVVYVVLTTAAHAETITPREASSHIGSTVTVEGVVSQVSITNSGTTFINYGGRYPDHIFYGVIFRSNAGQFSGVQSLEGQTVAISGTIELYEGKPQIIVSSPMQIEVP